MSSEPTEAAPWPPKGRKALRKARNQLDRQIQELKTKRNTLSPFLRLPVELILNIIRLVSESSHLAPSSYPAPSSRPWLPITHVCRHLRDVAIAEHTLWNRIGCHEGAWVDELVRRSGNSPLHLSLFGFEAPHIKRQRNSVEVLAKHIHKASHIHIEDVMPAIAQKGLSPLLADTAPCLRSLAFHYGAEAMPAYYHFPSSLFRNGAPHLSDISLSAVMLHANVFSAALPSLTTLSLYRVTFKSKSPENRPVLIKVLSGIPALQNLTIKWCDLQTDFAEPLMPKLHIEDLEYLEIADGTPYRIHLLLGSISLPSQNLKLEFQESEGDAGLLAQLLSRATAFWSSVERRERAGTNGLSVAFFDESDGGAAGSPHSMMLVRHPDLACSLELQVHNLDVADTRVILNALTDRAIEEIEVYDQRDLFAVEQNGVLGKCERLVLDVWDTADALAWFVARPAVCASLTHLIIRDDKLKHDLGVLNKWFKARPRAHHKLERLEIECAGEPGKKLADLMGKWRKTVSVVELCCLRRRSYDLRT